MGIIEGGCGERANVRQRPPGGKQFASSGASGCRAAFRSHYRQPLRSASPVSRLVARTVEGLEVAAKQRMLDLPTIVRLSEMSFGDVGGVIRPVHENVVPGRIPGRPRPRDGRVPLIAPCESEIDPVNDASIGEAKVHNKLASGKAWHGNILYSSLVSFEHDRMPESRLPQRRITP